MKKVLFIDRDGTIIHEPEGYQIDNLDKLEFFPEALYYISKIAKELDYELVMVTNQDGLGTDSFPEGDFWPIQRFIEKTFANEGAKFEESLIDRSFPEDNAPTRKPRTGLLEKKYLKSNGSYDLQNSFMVGDRMTDMEFALNFGGKGIFIDTHAELGSNEVANDITEVENCIVLKTDNWKEIYEFLKLKGRTAEISRKTNETNIKIKLNLDGTGSSKISTGLAFFDHMLDQIARHGQMDLEVQVKGDLEVDEHHTIEDTAIALGEVFSKPLETNLELNVMAFVFQWMIASHRLQLILGAVTGLCGKPNSKGKW
jgi:imidazoleglycerol-phosphate dehydratase / histidinol-phosphatase